MKILTSIFVAAVFIAIESNWTVTAQVTSQAVVVKIEEDFAKFETTVKNFDTTVTATKDGDKRKWEAALSSQLLQDNLKEFKLPVTKMSLLKKNAISYQRFINDIYNDFKQKHATDIKRKNRSEKLELAAETYLKRFEKEGNQIADVEFKVHNELVSRIKYAEKLTTNLKGTDVKTFKSVAEEGKKVLSLTSTNVLEIREQLKRFNYLLQQANAIKKFFGDNLMQLLTKEY
ncbi:uncharacterized protein LOC116341213 [Contarinia nasturtii]|uniref:uncharacterized protein LOC116341213 n=1 Tax=Contarinia nasturtii TaxID=265458 RepID=UPI0012D38736|nr:uncharacterized protein LOC116341213 [Contarinia nasturtii]